FYLEADVLKPEGKFGLSGDRAVYQRVARPDAHYAAPGAFSEQRAEFHQFKAMAEDIPVAAGVFIGQRDHRPGDRFLGIRARLAPARDIVADLGAGELL